MSFASGMSIGKYELGKKLGQGGFGLVFVARDSGLDRDVALKLMHPEHVANADILRRFLQEARSAAKVVHPGIVTVFECGQAGDGVAYIAMELLHGESLSDRLARVGRLAPDAAIEIGRQVASALEAAHRAGIVHRDLKPDNIFLVKDPAMPSGERVKVLDFGIAKLAAGTQAASSGVQTQSMMVFGTPRYMSPEQCRSAAHVDHRSDIYTLGCILYELVSGRAPFDGELGELIAKHQMMTPPQAAVTGPLAHLIDTMLAKAPGERPQTMRAVEDALAAGGSLVSGVAPTLPPDAIHSMPPTVALRPAPANPTTLSAATGGVSTRAASRHRGVWFAGAGAALAIGGVALWLGLQRGGAEPAPVAPPAPAPVAAAAPAPVVPAPPPAADVELLLAAIPKAEVYLAADGRLLGETPYKQTRTSAEGQIVFLLKAEGYRDERVVMPANRSDARTVTLVAIEKPAAPVKHAPPKPPTPPPVKPTGDQIEVYK